MAMLLREFVVGGEVLQLSIFTQEDDRTEVQDTNGKILMIFTANCEVYLPNKNGRELIGNVTNQYGHWIFTSISETFTPMSVRDSTVESIYDLEVLVATTILQTITEKSFTDAKGVHRLAEPVSKRRRQYNHAYDELKRLMAQYGLTKQVVDQLVQRSQTVARLCSVLNKPTK